MAFTDPLDAEAPPGSLDPDVHRDLQLMKRFSDTRDHLAHKLLGASMARNPLGLEIIRTVAVEFGYGRLQRLSFYQRYCSGLGSKSAVRDEAQTLAAMHIIILRTNEEKRGTTIAVPTKRLVHFYNTSIPALADEARTLFIARSRMSG